MASKAEHQRRWREAHKEERLAYQREYRKRNAEKNSARAAINNRLYRGTLTKPAACESCLTRGPVDAHHPDHSRPLDVRWLCRSCHAKEDANG